MKGNKKLCWNCDGSVHIFELKCPYCAALLTPSEEKDETSDSTVYIQSSSPNDENPEIPPPPYEAEFSENDFEPSDQEWEGANLLKEELEPQVKEELEPQAAQNECNSLIPLLFLLPGSVFLLYGLALFLFSDEGVLTFHFNAKYWFFYIFASLPLIYFGLKMLYPSNNTQTTEATDNEGVEEERLP